MNSEPPLASRAGLGYGLLGLPLAFVALPLLDLLGYQPGTSPPETLQALTLAYAGLPCVLKLLAALALYFAFFHSRALSPSPHSEAP